MAGRIHVGDHLACLYTKYISCGPYDLRRKCVLRNRCFKSFYHYKTMGSIAGACDRVHARFESQEA